MARALSPAPVQEPGVPEPLDDASKVEPCPCAGEHGLRTWLGLGLGYGLQLVLGLGLGVALLEHLAQLPLG